MCRLLLASILAAPSLRDGVHDSSRELMSLAASADKRSNHCMQKWFSISTLANFQSESWNRFCGECIQGCYTLIDNTKSNYGLISTSWDETRPGGGGGAGSFKEACAQDIKIMFPSSFD